MSAPPEHNNHLQPSAFHLSGRELKGKNKRIALVTQGGGQRGIFTAGVLDSFINHHFDPFQLYIGTSAGALNLIPYLARNYGFAYQFITQYTTDSRFFNLLKYVRRQQLMDLDWALDAVDFSDPQNLGLVNARSVLQQRNAQAFACVTDAASLKPYYLPLLGDNWLDVVKATSAVPLLYNGVIEIDGQRYIDGGISGSVPAKEAYSRGADIVVVIRTEPVSADKKPLEASRVEKLRRQVESRLPDYLHKLSLDDRFDKLQAYHGYLAKHFKQLHERYASNAWDQLKGKVPDGLIRNGGRWLFGGDSIYRLQALSGQKINRDMVEMLTQHFASYQECIKFMQTPPARLQVMQICPSASLASSPLLSKMSQLQVDYYHGVDIGNAFIANYAADLNEISSIKDND